MIHTPTPDWCDGMQMHPAAELVPMMADTELDHPARNGRMRQRPMAARRQYPSGSRDSTRNNGSTEVNACSKDLADKAVREFAVSILHGDKAHQDWLIEATERFIAGKKPPKPPRLTSDQVVERYLRRAHARSATSGGRRMGTETLLRRGTLARSSTGAATRC